MMISFVPMGEFEARQIIDWRYEPPYDIYNLEGSEDECQYAIDPENNFYAMYNQEDALVGFCSFGDDGQVPGGDYASAALDIGMGIHPEFTGQGLGESFVNSVLNFARKKFQPNLFRVTIAEFNQRAQRVWKKNDFRACQTFTHQSSNRDFNVMIRGANPKKNAHQEPG